jgi:hypothetical protein
VCLFPRATRFAGNFLAGCAASCFYPMFSKRCDVAFPSGHRSEANESVGLANPVGVDNAARLASARPGGEDLSRDDAVVAPRTLRSTADRDRWLVYQPALEFTGQLTGALQGADHERLGTTTDLDLPPMCTLQVHSCAHDEIL